MGNISISELKEKTIDELTDVAKELKVEGAAGLRKQDLIFAILQAQSKVAEAKKEEMEVAGEGTLEVTGDVVLQDLNRPVLDLLEGELKPLGFTTRRHAWIDEHGVEKQNLTCRRGPDLPGGLALIEDPARCRPG